MAVHRTIFSLQVYLTLVCTLYSSISLAQTNPVPQDSASTGVVSPDASTASADKKVSEEAPELKILKSIEAEIKKRKGREIFERSSVPSLVFTPSQYALLREARIGFNTRIPTLQELSKLSDPNDPNYRPPTALRDVKLGGIAYNTPDDWTIWLNNARVTPDAIPAEAIDLRVYKEFIELKWYDALKDQIFPIRLRINQKFNLDNRIFLPAN